MRLVSAALLVALLCAGCSRENEATSVPLGKGSAIFAGGCFWPMTLYFERLPGVETVVAGVTGGSRRSFTEAEFVRGETGHVEAVQVIFDPSRTSYRQLVDRYWRMIDPTDQQGQFCDRGPTYAPAVFASAEQWAVAEESRQTAAAKIGLDRFNTPVRPAGRFYAASIEHQGFARLNPGAYARYAAGCGRDRALRDLWGETEAP